MNKEQVKISKACEITGKSRIFFDHNNLSQKDEKGCVYVKHNILKNVINEELINAQEHLHRLEIYEKKTANK